MIEKDSGYCVRPCYDISIVVNPCTTVLAHVMVLTCNRALISVMALTNAMVAIRVFCQVV